MYSVVSLCFSSVLSSVFSENSNADCKAHHPNKHALDTAWLTDSHSSRVPRQSTNNDDHGTYAFPFPTGCTVLHPTGKRIAMKLQMRLLILSLHPL